MLTRFLIVILAVLNVGVALWWMTSRPSEPAVPASAEPGVATLELLQPSPDKPAATVDASTTPVTSPAPALVAMDTGKETAAIAAPPEAKPEPPPVAAAATRPLPEQCSSLGPFADRTTAQAALAALGSDVRRQHLREVPGRAASSYRVLIPPAASREEAQATAKRIVDAGFSDYFIVAQGEEAHAVALGQYRNREGAERRLTALAAAGFPAKLVTNGSETPASWWLDVASTVDPAALKQRASAAQQQLLNCTRLR